MAEMIERLIWHHGASLDELSDSEKRAVLTWINLNPEWDYQFCTDEMLNEFSNEFLPEEMNDVYLTLPTDAMKVEMWRYAVLYEFGGISTQTNSICRKPLNEWLDVAPYGGVEKLHVACENDSPRFCNQTIIAPPKHPALKIALDLIVQRITNEKGLRLHSMAKTGYFTGAELWTTAIQRYLGSCEEPMTLFHLRKNFADKNIEIHPCYFFDGVKVRQGKRSSDERA